MGKIWLIVTFLMLSCYQVADATYTVDKKLAIKLENEQFSEEALLSYILEKKIKHPTIVYAQAVLETGQFTSKIFKENNNLFGMKYIHDCKCSITRKGTRPTTAIGSKYKHAKYIHWKKSVDDYLLWQQMFKKTPIETEQDYLKLLGKRYAEDKRYVSAIKIILKQGYGNTNKQISRDVK